MQHPSTTPSFTPSVIARLRTPARFVMRPQLLTRAKHLSVGSHAFSSPPSLIVSTFNYAIVG